ncbi:MAG TPA: hypothetical protein VFG79_01360 [Solirubrobacter sp.]|jgi:hypothetical protein|nr:hypothetical protein [Solirubrobacter sp.]
MDTIHSILAAQYVQERMDEATGARAARDSRRPRPQKAKPAAKRRPLLARRIRSIRLP